MKKEERLFDKIDGYLKSYGNLNLIDIRQLLSNNNAATSLVKKYLNSKNNFIDVQDAETHIPQRIWFHKKLKEYTCKFCGKKFKSQSNQWFCKNECKTRYINNKEQEINFII